MVIDLKKINLGETIEDDALWVVEQVPSLVVGADQTPILRAGRLDFISFANEKRKVYGD